jgi:hypothetical protein
MKVGGLCQLRAYLNRRAVFRSLSRQLVTLFNVIYSSYVEYVLIFFLSRDKGKTGSNHLLLLV